MNPWPIFFAFTFIICTWQDWGSLATVMSSVRKEKQLNCKRISNHLEKMLAIYITKIVTNFLDLYSHDESALCSLQHKGHMMENFEWKIVNWIENIYQFKRIPQNTTWNSLLSSRACVSKRRPHFHNRGRMFSSISPSGQDPFKFLNETQCKTMYKRYNVSIWSS